MGDYSISQCDAMSGTLSDFSLDFDLMDCFLLGGCWSETSHCNDPFQQGNSTSAFLDSPCFSLSEINNCSSSSNLPKSIEQNDQERSVLPDNSPSLEAQTETIIGSKSPGPNSIETAECSGQLKSYPARGGRNFNEYEKISSSTELSGMWWIDPMKNLCPFSSAKERFAQALKYIKDSIKENDVLVQIWVPINRGGKRVLTIFDQPFSLDPSCRRLVNYRTVSVNYQFPAEEELNEVVGLPGRVFLGRLPEWTPDVRYFSSDEYPRVQHAQQNDVRGTLALPVFERGSQACLGVVEVVRTTQKINYSSELESICNALQVVNLRSSENASVTPKVNHNFYQVALPEIVELMRAVCESHRLPLAQTWVPCMQHGKKGSRHLEENYANCVSTVDTACHVTDPRIWGFHEACSEHHLFKGQGVAGKAFTTNQPCFSTDVTAFSKSEYPLSHYAQVFGLRAAVAIRLRSIYSGTADFVLEFFLPFECREIEEQRLMLHSLSMIIQQVCRSLRVVTEKELENESALPHIDLVPSGGVLIRSSAGADGGLNQERIPTEGKRRNSVKSKMKGKGSVFHTTRPLGCQKETKGFSIRTDWDCPELIIGTGEMELNQQHEGPIKSSIGHGDSSFLEQNLSNIRKVTKGRAKTAKNISLQVLRQYFARTLKDAAKCIGVCPTTLKRICRMHGISRWPSRTFKKIDYSLQRLRVVIDSVQGVEGASHTSPLYVNSPHAHGSSFTSPKLSKSSVSFMTKQTTGPMVFSNMHPEGVLGISATFTKSPSSSCSHSSSSSLSCSSGEQQSYACQLVVGEAASMAENHGGMLNQACSEAELCSSTKDEQKSSAPSPTQTSHSKHLSLQKNCRIPSDNGSLKAKVMFGDENIRITIHPAWGFQDLQQQVAKRFNIDDASTFVLKYLDEESEWMLLTCDDDLQECKDVYESLCSQLIKLSVHHIAL